MDARTRLVELLKEFRTPICKGLNFKLPGVEGLADYLMANGLTILPEGAIILTKEEIAALNEYAEKHGSGGDALEKE